jgi:uncharacterized protein YqhQ
MDAKMVREPEMSKFFYGGQAVIEGVMMRGRYTYAVAVRSPSGQIVVAQEDLPKSLRSGTLIKVPFLRGVLMLWEMLSLGLRSLTYSANISLGTDGSKLGGPTLWGTVAVSLSMAVGLFMVFPLVAVSFADAWITSPLASNLLEGFLRLGVLLGYLGLIGLVPDIRRVFGYHGAEHKAINALEQGDPLSVESVQSHSVQHPRCGTAFLLVVVAVSILVFALLGRPDMWLRLSSRVLLVPAIAGIAYEMIRIGARYYHLKGVRLALAPTMALQRLTTRQPDDSMVEVAIAALMAVLRREGVIIPASQKLPVDEVHIGDKQSA